MDLSKSHVSTNMEDDNPITYSMPEVYDQLQRYWSGKEAAYEQTPQDYAIRQLLVPSEMQKLQDLVRNQLGALSGTPTRSPIDSILEQLLSEESSWPPMMDPTKQSSWTPD